MNALDYGVVSAELERARKQLDEARKALERARSTATIIGGVTMAPIHLAHYQVGDTIRLIDQSLGKAPEPPKALSIDEMIAHAKARTGKIANVTRAPSPDNGCNVTDPLRVGAPSAQDACAASATGSVDPTLSSSPQPENMGSADTPPSREAGRGEDESAIANATAKSESEIPQ